MRYPLLSFLELQRLSKLLDPALAGAQIDRIFIPECPEHPQGFFKNEFVLEFRHSQLLISLRSQACGIAFLSKKGLKPAKGAATRSAFDLSLGKELVGLRLSKITVVPGDRLLKIEFPESTLFLRLLPAIPEGTLVSNNGQVITSSKARENFSIPPAREITPEVLAKVPDRTELVTSLDHYAKEWMDTRKLEALTLRKQKLTSHLDQQFQAVKRKIKSLEQQAEQAKNDLDWKYFGSLLQTHMHSKPVLKNKHYSLMDYEKNEEVLVPGDSKLNLKQQLEKYFHQAKRNQKRIEEGAARSAELSGKLAQLEKSLTKLRASELSFEELKKIEESTSLSPAATDKATSKKIAGYAGKTYRSKEGFTILSGRSKDENIELTFKVAKGNDLWLHVKGRPGSHTIILLPPNKTASLDTLLDAANLCILHSGGKEWGKTEVDYTQRKFVKKIKNQTDVTYSGNKTLVVSIEPDRIKRLYSEEND